MSQNDPEDTPDAPNPDANYQSKIDRNATGLEALQGIFANIDAEDAPAPEVVVPPTPEAAAPAEPTDPALAVIANAEARSRGLLDQREAELNKREESIGDRMSKIEEFDQLRSRFMEDPVAVARELSGGSKSPEELAAMFYSALPDIDEEIKSNGQMDGIQARLDRMEKENQEYRAKEVEATQHRERQTFRDSYVGEIRSYLSSEDTTASDDLTFVNAYYAANPDAATADVFTLAGQMAQERGKGPLVRAPEVAQKLNETLSQVFGPMIEAMVKAKTEGNTPTAPVRHPADNRTLSNSASAPTTLPTNKKMTRQERLRHATAWANANMNLNE